MLVLENIHGRSNMSLINHHGEHCVGITLFRFGQRNIELWFINAEYTIEKHSHPEENIELMFLFGFGTTFFRKTKTNTDKFFPRWPLDMFKRFSVRAGDIHWFTTTTWPLVFINFSWFIGNYNAKSAASDFKGVIE